MYRRIPTAEPTTLITLIMLRMLRVNLLWVSDDAAHGTRSLLHEQQELYTTQNLLRVSFLTLHISVLSLTIHLYENLIIVYLSYRFVMYSLY